MIHRMHVVSFAESDRTHSTAWSCDCTGVWLEWRPRAFAHESFCRWEEWVCHTPHGLVQPGQLVAGSLVTMWQEHQKDPTNCSHWWVFHEECRMKPISANRFRWEIVPYSITFPSLSLGAIELPHLSGISFASVSLHSAVKDMAFF